MTTFIGFTTVGRITGSTVLEDQALARRDLLNHFNTRKGERLGEPEFGSILPELIFEPNDLRTQDLVDDDIRNIVGLDPRWRLRDYKLSSTDHSITVTVQLTYVPDLSNDYLVLEYRNQEDI